MHVAGFCRNSSLGAVNKTRAHRERAISAIIENYNLVAVLLRLFFWVELSESQDASQIIHT